MEYYKEINNILQRDELIASIREKIISFKSYDNVKQNIFIYGDCGIGKTFLVKNIIKDLAYDILYYDNIDNRNKTTMENISSGFKGNQNVIQLFHKIKKKIVIVMDDVENMNVGDKSGISSLIKMVRYKKTKKQQTEESSANQIICISNSLTDKKIKELANGCIQIKIPSPTKKQMKEIIQLLMPELRCDMIFEYTGVNIRKIYELYKIYVKNERFIDENFFNIIRTNYSSDENKLFTRNIINMKNETYSLNELDKNIIGLLWHENIIDIFSKIPPEQSISMYIYFMQNICFADYIDKFIFQKQIWQLNDLTFLIKVFKNMEYYKKIVSRNPSFKCNIGEARFTKILTKYSTEYNNYVFLKEMCQMLLLDKNDLYHYFLDLQKYNVEEIIVMLEKYDIGKLNVNRIFKFLDKLLKGEDEDEI